MPTTSPPSSSSSSSSSSSPPHYPRIIITYCTQCKWLLRAAYHAQELLSTFSTSLGEVSLRPATGGVYWVDVEVEVEVSQTAKTAKTAEIAEIAESARAEAATEAATEANPGMGGSKTYRIWDRKAQDGFPGEFILNLDLVPSALPPSLFLFFSSAVAWFSGWIFHLLFKYYCF